MSTVNINRDFAKSLAVKAMTDYLSTMPVDNILNLLEDTYPDYSPNDIAIISEYVRQGWRFKWADMPDTVVSAKISDDQAGRESAVRVARQALCLRYVVGEVEYEDINAEDLINLAMWINTRNLPEGYKFLAGGSFR